MKLKITREEREGLKKVFTNFGRKKNAEQIFYDLCFCICSPQTTFKNNIKVIDELKREDFYNLQPKSIDSEGNLYFYGGRYFNIYNKLKPTRFYKQKTWRLIEAKEKFPEILKIITGDCWIETYPRNKKLTEEDIVILMRNWLVKNVKGLGMKTASHFLRNLGESKLAIIDTHIIKFLATQTVDGKKISMQPCNKLDYLFMEKRFQKVAKRNRLTTAELDALIWQRYSKSSWDAFKW